MAQYFSVQLGDGRLLTVSMSHAPPMVYCTNVKSATVLRIKKANGDRRQIGAAPHYFEIAALTKAMMTTKAIIIIIIIKSTISLY